MIVYAETCQWCQDPFCDGTCVDERPPLACGPCAECGERCEPGHSLCPTCTHMEES